MTAGILFFVGVLLLAPAASAQGLFRSDALVLYDSTGKTVGTLSQPGNLEVVFRTGAGRTIFVVARAASLNGNANLYFSETGCSGSPFLTRADSGRQPSSHISGPRQTVHVQAGEFGRRRMQSALLADGRCVDSARTSDFARAVPAGIDLADYFTPPFQLRATPGEAIPTGAVAEPLDPTDRLVVYDANGKKVGATRADGVYAPAAAVVAVVTASGMTLLLTVDDSYLSGQAYFESTDCTGPPFIFDDGVGDHWANLVPVTTLVGPRRAVHAPSGNAATRTMSSVDYGSGECYILRNRIGIVGQTGRFVPLEPIGLELADYFTPPFTVRAGRGTRALPTPD
jgi:hypothetical protein